MDKKKPLIGLTGGIASGKSSVSRILASQGIDIVDADSVAREVVADAEQVPLGRVGVAALERAVGERDERARRRERGREAIEEIQHLLLVADEHGAADRGARRLVVHLPPRREDLLAERRHAAEELVAAQRRGET